MKTIQVTIDGQKHQAPMGGTILEAIRAAGIYVPTLCHDPELKPFGACRLCIVQVEGLRGLPTACTTPVQDNMVIRTETDEIQEVRRTIVELAIANHPYDCLVCDKSRDCELLSVARYLGARKSAVDRFRRTTLSRPVDASNPAFSIDPDKCILCGKCVRTCSELQGVGAIDFAFRGYQTRISTFGAGPIVDSTCQSCGECVARCPTGALMTRAVLQPQKEVQTICPYCGVGCGIYLGVRGQKIVRVRGDNQSPVNRGALCVKGRFGLDFVNHRDRLTRPLIRKKDFPRSAAQGDTLNAFREAGWDEALEVVAGQLAALRDGYGPDSIGVLSSAKCTNEDNYLVQKFARAVIGTNNVDHCARLCHASTVTAALAAFGDGAMSNSIADIDQADLLFVIGSNTTECHPVIGRKIKQALSRNGTGLIVADPRAIELSTRAAVYINHKPGTDVALLNSIMNGIVQMGLHKLSFINDRCEDVKPFLESLKLYTPERVSKITGVSAEKIQQAAILFGRAKSAMVLYGMGITQHTTGTDNVKAIANLLMLTGNIGREGTGFSPLRGQNNVQGACDLGALPNVFPGYQRVNDPAVLAKFKSAWGGELSGETGLTLTDMFRAAHEGRIKALFIVGENPMMSEPDLQHAKAALAKLDFLVVQDIFPTETARMADVVLPAASFAEKDGTFTSTERRVQLVRKAVEPPGEARLDWEIIDALSEKLGRPFSYKSSSDIMDEIASVTPIYGGISHKRLGETGGLQWPCRTRDDPGTPILHLDSFTRGRGKFHVVHDKPPAEQPSGDYPLLLTTGRILEHWHTGSMSHRSRVLEALSPESSVEISPADADRLGIFEGDIITLRSKRGELQTRVKETLRVFPGLAFMAFHWGDAPANLLTNPEVDPLAKIPEFKVSYVNATLAVLARAARDNAFLAALAANPARALKSYPLTVEQRAALASGDIAAIEKWLGYPLDDRLLAWLKARLEQERW
ncbi:MAG: formate dehydrogenase subunit alpha [Thermodesulfobacteriota bacterium]